MLRLVISRTVSNASRNYTSNIQKSYPFPYSKCKANLSPNGTNFIIRRSVVTSPMVKAEAEFIDVTFIRADGSAMKVKGKVGDNLLDVVLNNNVDIDGFGACEGTLSCSTCHLIFSKADFDKIDDKITDEELDMLDLAYGLTETSRLGCQVCLTKKLNGLVANVPAGINDQRT